MAYWNEEWSSKEWLENVQTWVDHVLQVYQLERTGELQRRRGQEFSALMSVPTQMGRLWFKATNPNQVHEPTLTAKLSELVPHRIAKPLSIEPNLGWSLSPDYGKTFMALPPADINVWELLLGDYAQFQQELIGQRDTLFDAGMNVIDPEWIPHYLETQLEFHAMTDPEHPLHLDPETADRLFVNVDQLSQWSTMLAEGPVPLTLDHQDLHRNNVLVPASVGEPLRYLDFADAFWAHPFSSLAKPLRTVEEEFALDLRNDTTGTVNQILGSYLYKWEKFGSADDLYELIEPALRLSRLQEHQVWMNLVTGADEQTQRKFAPNILRPLRNLLEPVLTPEN